MLSGLTFRFKGIYTLEESLFHVIYLKEEFRIRLLLAKKIML